MAHLAIAGGRPIRSTERDAWPQWPRFDEGDRARLQEVLESRVWSYNGPMEQRAAQMWSVFQDSPHTVVVANGTVSLQLALEALDIGYGDEVIIPGLTWQATAAAIIDVNAVPVMVDVDPVTWCIDPALVRGAITERTKAIIPVHLYGAMSDMDALMEIAKEFDLAVIEDTAHQHGSEWRGRKAGTIGEIGSFSLQLSKPLTAGEGGLLNTASESLWQRLEALRNCGRKPATRGGDDPKSTGVYVSEGNFIQSGNYRITEFQAALLIGGISRLEVQRAHRERNARVLDEELSQIDGITPITPYTRQNRRAFFNYAVAIDIPAYLGVDVAADRVRNALAAELKTPVSSCYEPLNDCSLYRPLTKRRYQINSDHTAAIDPSRFSLPVSEDLFANKAITFHHSVLLEDSSKAGCIVDAFVKVRNHRDEL